MTKVEKIKQIAGLNQQALIKAAVTAVALKGSVFLRFSGQ